jgi:flavodoxin
MKAIVIYASRYGNTERVAEAIADGLSAHGIVELTPVENAPATFADADLVVVGGPTEGHGMTPPVRQFLDSLEQEALKGMPAAAFETRLDWPRWMSGSAGAGISGRLRKLGADIISAEASFIVEGKEPVLKPGELDRAKAWGDTLARAMRAQVAAVH